MRLVITGATGLIGKALCERLVWDYEIIALTRNTEKAKRILGPDIKAVEWDGFSYGQWAQYIEGASAVINLAGENVASGRWTQAKMGQILRSRVNVTKTIVEAITVARQKPGVLIQASAIGFYGCREEPVDENAGKGGGFLADVCEKWEQAAAVEVRIVFIRTGLVLSSTGGALPRLIMPFKFFTGGYPGTGKQWVSWITIDDEIAAIKFLIENQQLSGAFNLTTPNPVTMKELAQTIGRVLKRPCWLPVPALVLRLIAGKMADEILLSGQRVFPNRLLKAGFKFAQPGINEALEFILGKAKK